MIRKGLLSFITAALLFTSCSSSDKLPETNSKIEVQIENLDDKLEVAKDKSLQFKAVIKSELESQFYWLLDGEVQAEAKDSIFTFTAAEVGDYKLTLKVTDIENEAEVSVDIHVFGQFRDGAFVLNEGQMGVLSSTLVFISPDGTATSDVYKKVNNRNLGNVTQDLFIAKDKIYFISQNGADKSSDKSLPTDGILTIANAETLEKIQSFEAEFEDRLSWPTHIAVPNESNVFIRDGKGIHQFNPSSLELNFVEGSERATKITMAVVGNRVFAISGNKLIAMEAGVNKVVKTADFNSPITGVLPSYDGKLWLAVNENSKPRILKVEPKSLDVIQENTISVGALGRGWGATSSITAKGDTIYYSNAETNIYRHIFSENKSTFLIDSRALVENANMIYNTIAVDPTSGYLYQTTIKGFGQDYKSNNISIFNFNGDNPKLEKNLVNFTAFPGGTFFTANFNK